MRTYIDTGAWPSITEMESESRPTLDLGTDIFQSQKTNLTASEHQVSRGMAHSVRGLAYLSTGLHQPRERVKFGRRYFAEKVALSL